MCMATVGNAVQGDLGVPLFSLLLEERHFAVMSRLGTRLVARLEFARTLAITCTINYSLVIDVRVKRKGIKFYQTYPSSNIKRKTPRTPNSRLERPSQKSRAA